MSPDTALASSPSTALSRSTSGSHHAHAPLSAAMAASHSLPVRSGTGNYERQAVHGCEPEPEPEPVVLTSSTGDARRMMTTGSPAATEARARDAIAPWDALDLPLPTAPVCAPLTVEPYTMMLPLPLPLSDALVHVDSEGQSTSTPRALRWLKVAYTPFSDVQDTTADQTPTTQAFRVTAQLLASDAEGVGFAPYVPVPTGEMAGMSDSDHLLPPPMSFPTVLGFCSVGRQLELIPDGWRALGCPFPRTDSSGPQQRLWYAVPDLILAGATIMMDL